MTSTWADGLYQALKVPGGPVEPDGDGGLRLSTELSGPCTDRAAAKLSAAECAALADVLAFDAHVFRDYGYLATFESEVTLMAKLPLLRSVRW